MKKYGSHIVVAIIAAVASASSAEMVRKGWNLTPVTVAAMDIPEGTTITLDI